MGLDPSSTSLCFSDKNRLRQFSASVSKKLSLDYLAVNVHLIAILAALGGELEDLL